MNQSFRYRKQYPVSNDQVERAIQQRAWAQQNWKQWSKDQNAVAAGWVTDIKPEKPKEPEEFSHPA